MLKRFRSKDGQSLLEYVTLIILIMAAFLAFQKYIVRGISGRYKTSIDSLGHGKQFGSTTIQCMNDVFTDRPDIWFEEECFRSNCEEDCLMFQDLMDVPGAFDDCRTCIDGCRTNC